MSTSLSPNLGLSLVRVTEEAALTAGRWMGRGDAIQVNLDTTQAMARAFNTLDINGRIVIGEEGRLGFDSPLSSGRTVGTGKGPELDVVADAIDGTEFLIHGRPGAISVAAIAPRGSMWSPAPAIYMDKIVVGPAAADVLVPECMDAPAAWTLALVARALDKSVRDLVVFVLDRPRHRDLMNEIRATGARLLTRGHGDIAGALMAASGRVNVDILMGIGGVAEGVIAACAVKALRGAMLGRLAPQSADELQAIRAAGLDEHSILTADEMVRGERIFFAATGITDGPLFPGVRYRGKRAETFSWILRAQTGTLRAVHTEHLLDDEAG